MFYDAGKATLDIDKLDEEYVQLGKGLMYFAQCFAQYNELANALAKGDLSVPLPPPENELAAPLKSLQASLKHLTWQSQQVAKGNYKQSVDFMGEFSDAFNTMIRQLSERQQKLEDEIEVSLKKTKALERSNQLLGNITQYIPQQILVTDVDTHEILFMNNMAKCEIQRDPEYFEKLMEALVEHRSPGGEYTAEVQFAYENEERYLSVNSYSIEWNQSSAEALVIKDISSEKNQIKELETQAYRDSMTNLYNRLYGMRVLDEWLSEKKSFSLIFADLDRLKYINDKFGHSEGDEYINNAAKHLKNFSEKAIVCRIGGDEFMLLAPDISYDKAHDRMNELCDMIQNDENVKYKEYQYSISFGIVVVEEDNVLPAGLILSMADEKMYEHKRSRKKNRS